MDVRKSTKTGKRKCVEANFRGYADTDSKTYLRCEMNVDDFHKMMKSAESAPVDFEQE